MIDATGIWAFTGDGATFPSGVFSTREHAAAWILRHRLSGTLTWYPVNEGAYDWAIRLGEFAPKSEHHRAPIFIQRFTSGSQQHFHFVDGTEK